MSQLESPHGGGEQPSALAAEDSLLNRIDWNSGAQRLRRHTFANHLDTNITSGPLIWNDDPIQPNHVTHPDVEGKDWTYLVNLSASLFIKDGELGAAHKSAELKQLAKLTEHSNAQVIVQSVEPLTRKLTIYRLAGGQIEELGGGHSDGGKADLEQLLSYVPHDGKVAFINQSHGGGGWGVQSDGFPGRVRLDDLKELMQSALKCSGRSRFDLVAFDACLMSNASTFSELSPLTQNMVASETYSFGIDKSNDSIALTNSLRRALTIPPVDGEDLAGTMVDESAQACANAKPRLETCGVETLARLDGEAAPEFAEAYSKFGDALARALDQGDNRKVLESIISRTSDASSIPESDMQLRDLGQFTQEVLDALDKGGLKDDSNLSLRRAVTDIRVAEADALPMLFDHHNTMTGMNVFLPDERPEFDRSHPERLAHKRIDDAQQALTSFARAMSELADRVRTGKMAPELGGAAYMFTAEPMIRALSAAGIDQQSAPPAVAEMQQYMKDMMTKKTVSADDFAELSNRANHNAKDMKNPPDKLVELSTLVARAQIDDVYGSQLSVSHPAGWERFIDALRPRP